MSNEFKTKEEALADHQDAYERAAASEKFGLVTFYVDGQDRLHCASTTWQLPFSRYLEAISLLSQQLATRAALQPKPQALPAAHREKLLQHLPPSVAAQLGLKPEKPVLDTLVDKVTESLELPARGEVDGP